MATQVERIKWVKGTNFIVDGFAFTSPKCKHYFLTHAHSDHTIGLRKSFSAGVIYCSHVTARLLIHDMGIRPEVVRPLEVGVPVVISGVRVTPLDANHCPGSVMFLFEVPVPTAGRQQAAAGADAAGICGGGGGAAAAAEAAAIGVKAEAVNGVEAGALVADEAGMGTAAGMQHVAGQQAADEHIKREVEEEENCSCQGGGNEDEETGELSRGAELEAGCQQLAALAAAAAAGGTQHRSKAAGATSEARQEELTQTGDGDSAPAVEGAGSPSARVPGTAGASGSASMGGCSGGMATHNILHTGDMRWQRWMRDQPGLAGVRVDTLYLDTTYALPRHRLPPQTEAIAMMVQAMREAVAEEPATLFVVAAYHIGKERAFLGAAQQLGAKVWAAPDKRKVLALLDLAPEQAALLEERPEAADIHVGGWGLKHEELQAYLASHKGSRWKRVVGIRPTGWTFRRKGGVSVWREGEVSILGVPYSEHSSWTDLCDAVSQLRPQRVVPTVNAATPAHRRSLVDRFAHLMDLSTDRSRLDVYLSRAAEAARVKIEAGDTLASDAAAAASHAGSATAAAAAAVCRVDLAAVDVGEQERILAQVQEQHRRRQEMQQRRTQLQQAQQQRRQAVQQAGKGKGRKRDRAEDGRPAEEAEGGALSGRCSGDDEEAAAGTANGRQLLQRRRQSSVRRSSCGPAATGTCMVDLTIDDETDEDEQKQQVQEPSPSRNEQSGTASKVAHTAIEDGGAQAAGAEHGSIRRFLEKRAGRKE
eukprot:XP_001702972.1 predicted protein [Chlamydomonas reinhardtii]